MRRRAVFLAFSLFVVSSPSLFAQTSGSGGVLVLSERTDGGQFEHLAPDGSGGVWAVGYTASAVATTPDAVQRAFGGGIDGLLVHIRADGTILYRTYIGGSGDDYARGVALDRVGNIYVAGKTDSTDFPTTSAAYDRTCGVDGTCRNASGTIEPDAFVIKLTPGGKSITYSTYLGGSDYDYAANVAADANGIAYVVGQTASSDMPCTPGAPRCSGGTGTFQEDGFYARLSADGSTLEYATHMGGSDLDDAYGIALDTSGNAYVSGMTRSNDFTLKRPLKGTFPSTATYQAWIARFTPSGLDYSTYIGGSTYDVGLGVAVSSDAVFLTGWTSSTDFPGAPPPSNGAAYVTKISLDGSAILRTTLFDGKNSSDSAYSVAVDATDTAFVVGYTNSTNLPVTPDAVQKASTGPPDMFFAIAPMADGAPAGPSYLTYLGGSAQNDSLPDYAFGVALDGGGGAFIAGRTDTTDFPLVNAQPSTSSPANAVIAHFAPASTLRKDQDGEVVIYTRDASSIQGNWQLVGDASAAGGERMWNPDAGVPKITTPAASPASYFEVSFQAQAGKAYHLWLRMKADQDSWTNDSVWVQFSDSLDTSGNPAWRIGSTSAMMVSLEDCGGCGEHGWGWNDNGYNTAGALVMFPTSGEHTIRIQQREDGISIDQIVLSSGAHLSAAPGSNKDDSRVLAQSIGAAAAAAPSKEIVLYVAHDRLAGGQNWVLMNDTTAASGARLLNPNTNQPKVTAVTSAYPDYFEVQFTPVAGIPYHLWVRGEAANDYWTNDSAYVQFSGSVDASGSPTFRIGTDNATAVVLEDCSGCGEQGWGWQDNAYGGFAAPIYFTGSGPQTIRVTRREDGFSIDQIVISAGTYLNSAPGALKNDTTIVPR